MLRSLMRGMGGELSWSLSPPPVGSRAGLRTVVPGLVQHRWGQRQRGWVFFGSFASALTIAFWTWGTPQGLGFLALAFLTHVWSVTDVLRQWSFPVYPEKRALVLVALSLATVLYIPLITALSVLAWPGFEPSITGVGFLVDRHAYRVKTPSQGQWVWVRPSASEKPRAARVVAVPGEEVEWTGHNWKVDGEKCELQVPGRFKSWPQVCRFKI
jgi:hypothetical protein